MQSVITKVFPVVTKSNTEETVTIYGENFTDGGDPIVSINNQVITPVSITNTEIVIILPKSLGVGVHSIIVLNGEEQP